jgi:hypothetical protein
MGEVILEILGKYYKRSVLIQFGKDHDDARKKARGHGIGCSIFGLILVILYLSAEAIISSSWFFIVFLPIIALFAFGGQTVLIATAIVSSFFLLLGIGLLIFSVIDRKEDYYINIAKDYIYRKEKNKTWKKQS